jgi:hypothetical protein
VNLEGADRILVVRGHEDDRRLVCFTQSRHHLEAIEVRHLDVEQHDIRGILPNRFHRLLAIGTGGHYLGLMLGLEQSDQPLASDRLVIGHDHSQRHPTISSRSLGDSGTGV